MIPTSSTCHYNFVGCSKVPITGSFKHGSDRKWSLENDCAVIVNADSLKDNIETSVLNEMK